MSSLKKGKAGIPKETGQHAAKNSSKVGSLKSLSKEDKIVNRVMARILNMPMKDLLSLKLTQKDKVMFLSPVKLEKKIRELVKETI